MVNPSHISTQHCCYLQVMTCPPCATYPIAKFYFLCKDTNLGKSGDPRRGEGGRERLIELLRSWQLSRKKREGGLYWPGPQQLPVHRSQWKFIFPIGHISFRIRLDWMLKLIRNYINPNGFAVHVQGRCPCGVGSPDDTYCFKFLELGDF